MSCSLALMPEVRAEAEIHCSAERIFDVITDLHGQDRWLTKSAAFRGTSELSSNPVTLGATYRKPGPLGVRNGAVTELERPAKLTFHQPMTLSLASEPSTWSCATRSFLERTYLW
jgi:hypothetical protein